MSKLEALRPGPPTALDLVFALLRIRRLALSLLLTPVLIGLFIIGIQTLGSIAYLRLINEGSQQYGARISTGTASKFLRKFVFGKSHLLQPAKVCDHTNGTAEGCALRSYDIVLQTHDPNSFDPQPFLDTFAGASERIHICTDCTSDFVVSINPSGTHTYVKSFPALAVLMLADSERFVDLTQHLVRAREERERLDDIQGIIEFHPPGLSSPIIFNYARNVMVLVLNVSITSAIILWLALRAHRQILDYFAKNDVLLPLLASCGKKTMYHALWLLTLTRVFVFLLAAVAPFLLLFVIAREFLSQINATNGSLILWSITVLFGLGALGAIVSVGELQQRYPLRNFLFKAVPFLLWVCGSLLWFTAILEAGPVWEAIASIISVLPVLGLTPILMAPLGSIPTKLLVFHLLTALLVIRVTVRHNTRWFASHVEEI